MINWILQQLEKQPSRLFYEKELLSKDASEFEKLKQEKLLVYLQLDNSTEVYGYGQATSLPVVKIGGEKYVINDEDVEPDPVPLEKADLAKYRFCFDRFADRLRIANGLSGSCFSLDRRQYYLGNKTVNRQQVALVFSLFANDKKARNSLLSLPAQFGHLTDSIMVITPTYEVGSVELSALLEAVHITIVPYSATQEWRINFSAFTPKLVNRYPETSLTAEQEEDYQRYEYKCRLTIHITGRITRSGANEVLIGGASVEVGDVPFLLFLRLILELFQSKLGIVSKVRLAKEGYLGEGTDDQAIYRLRRCFVRALGELKEKDFIEGYRPKTVRISVHPNLVTLNTERLLLHDHARVKTLVEQLVEITPVNHSFYT